MLSPATDRADATRPPPPAPPAGTAAEVPLRAELDALNLELRELKSTDFAVRAYVETWIAFVLGSVGVKLLVDWQRTNGKFPVVGIPLAVAGLALLVDAFGARMKKRKLAAVEDKRLERQKQLRLILGIDDAPVPFADDAVPPTAKLA
jgi:hypothetical protein